MVAGSGRERLCYGLCVLQILIFLKGDLDNPISSSNQLLRSMQTCRDMDLKCRRYSRSLKLRS